MLILISAAAAVRCIELHTSGKWARPLKLEPTEQVQIAQGLADGQGFITPFRRDDGSYVKDPSAYSPPGFPYLLGGVLAACRQVGLADITAYRLTYLLSIFAGSLAVLWLAVSAGTLCGRRGFWLVGAWGAVWPSMVTNSVALWDTPYSIAGIGWSLHVATRPRVSPPGFTWSAGAGFLGGLFTLFNPLVAPLCFLALVSHVVAPGAGRRGVRTLLVAMMVWGGTMGPWLIRNAVLFDRFVPIRNTLGFTLWVGNQPGIDGRATSSYRFQIGDNAEERRKLFEMGENAYMAMKQREAMAIIRADPSGFAWRTAHRFALYWLGDFRNQTVIWGIAFPMIGGINVLKALLNVAFVLCAIGGAFFWGRRPGRWVCWAGLLIMPLPYYITHYSSNYRVFVDPILCLMAGVFICRLAEFSMRAHREGPLRV